MLDYFALILLIFVALVLFYGIIAIHDIPYEIAKSRQHPQQDAIHIAGWISLFTLHVIWPFLWIWATLYRPDRGWGFIKDSDEKSPITQLFHQITELQSKIHSVEIQDKENQSTLKERLHDLQTRIESVESSKKEDKP